MLKEKIHISLTSSLSKIFGNTAENDIQLFEKFSALRGEKFSFQAVMNYRGDYPCSCEVKADSDIGGIKLYIVRDVPVGLAAYEGRCDDRYIGIESGLYPDMLEEYPGEVRLIPNLNTVLWVEVNVPKGTASGIHEIKFSAVSEHGDTAEAVFLLDIIGAALPEQTFPVTQWFHCDCLASYYGVEPLSEKHWEIISAFMDNYAEFGGNMILTPIFTPPLDTVVGGERPTVQLVDVIRSGKGYEFGFDKLERFMSLAESKGIRLFEMAHLFTQWGAEFTPKIVDSDGRKLSGWFLKADSEEYRELIIPLLTALKEFLKRTGRFERCYFHISDEPTEENISTYSLAHAAVKEILSDCKVMDALSDVRFYNEGLVRIPVADDAHIESFIAAGAAPLWTYFCCAQGRDGAANRFISMPSQRCRILGLQMYKYNISGFLHWGFNYYYSQHSKRLINPYLITDTDGTYPSGDAFLVYPLSDGRAAPSIREFVFNEALQDMRALRLLEKYMPHDDIVDMIESRSEEIRFTMYPADREKLFDSSFICGIRSLINEKIAKFSD